MKDTTLVRKCNSPLVATTALLLLLPSLGRSDSPAAPFPWVRGTTWGSCFFKMVPGDGKWVDGSYEEKRKPFGVAYRVGDDGAFEELWRTEGWYAFEAYLSNDGNHLARIGPWASDQENHSDLAVAFYAGGKEVKRYTVKELITDPDRLEYSVSHYNWRPEEQGRPTGYEWGFEGDSFYLVMIDKTTYDFDPATGEILSTGVDEAAKSANDILAEQEAKAERRAEELFRTAEFRGLYEAAFEISQMRAEYGKNTQIGFDGPEWDATLDPKKEYEYPCRVSMIAEILDGETIHVSITPEEIDEALEAILAHPFIRDRFQKGGATRVRLRITGDRLHRNTEELVEFLEELGSPSSNDPILRDWAYFIVDAKEPRYSSFHIHVKTGELIHSSWNERIYVDRNGQILKTVTE